MRAVILNLVLLMSTLFVAADELHAQPADRATVDPDRRFAPGTQSQHSPSKSAVVYGVPWPPPDIWDVPDPPKPHKPLDVPDKQIADTNAPSAYLPGFGSVRPTGEYRYAIPIQTPPGVAGMRPVLALTYSSRAGDGSLGVGWSLSGLSEIHRCAKTFAIDGKSDGVNYHDPTDALCIDGNRLIWTSQDGDTDYYVTEQETFARIKSTSKHVGAALTRSFTVYAKDGRILEYGPLVMLDYPENGLSMDLVWPLSRVSDRSNNFIDYKYRFDTKGSAFSYAIDAISYSSNTMSFEYDDRVLPTVSWSKGIGLLINLQLRRITLSTDSHPKFGHYSLDWALSKSTSRPLLTGVQQCTWKTCTQVKQFKYDEQPLSFSEHDYPGIAQPYVMDGELWADVAVMDVDGNGLDDLVYPYGVGTMDAVGSPVDVPAIAVAVHGFHPNDGAPSLTGVLKPMNLAANVAVPVDVDGDGRLEVLLFPATGDNFTDGFRLFRWDASQSNLVHDPLFPSVPLTSIPSMPLNMAGYNSDDIRGQTPYFVDFDGDGRPDMLRSEFDFGLKNAKLTFSRNESGGFKALQDTGIGVFSADAKALALRGGRAIERFGEHRGALHISDASKSTALTFYQDDNGVFSGSMASRCEKLAGSQYELLLDVNGDGLHDRLCVRAFDAGSGNAEVCINEGSGMWDKCKIATFVAPLPGSLDDGAARFLTGDLSGDGLDDLVIWQQQQAGKILVYRAFGGWGWAQDASFDLPDGLQVARLGDFNGDGRTDIAAVHGPVSLMSGPTLRLYLQNPRFPDALYEVRESGNARPSEVIWYEKWKPSSGAHDDCSYPQRCVKRGEITVVRAHRAMNPSLPDVLMGDVEATYYQYDEPRVDLKGRGFLGFTTVQTWNPQRPIQVTTTYRNNLIATTPPHRTAYPEATVPWRTRTVVPIMDVPKDGRSPSKNLPNSIWARIIDVTTTYKTVWTALDASYWVHPERSVTTEWEEEVCVNWDQAQHFAGGSIECIDGPFLLSYRRRTESYQYDKYGNLTNHYVENDWGTKAEVITDYEYRVSDWLLGLPKTLTEKSAKSQNDVWSTRVTGFAHDASGLLERIEVEPPLWIGDLWNADLRLTVEYKRNSAGVVISSRQTAPGVAARHQYVHYDASGIFPDVIWNDLGHARWSVYDDTLGVPTVTLENVQSTQWVHDGLGRIREVHPDGAAKLLTSYALRENEVGQFVGTDIVVEGAAGDHAVISTDELGRTTEIRHLGFEGQWIHRGIQYDALGRVYQISRPGYAAPAAVGHVYERDSLDRLTREIGPDNKMVEHTHSFFKTLTIDADGRARAVVRDVNGRVTSTISYTEYNPKDPQAAKASITMFTYDAFDLIGSITDPKSNVTTMTYDALGRRKTISDPNAGLFVHYYNGFGERRASLSSIDYTEFHYDKAGRVVRIDHEVDGTTKYVWDIMPNDTSVNGMGQLVATTSPDGTGTRRTYDAHGRLSESKWDVEQESFSLLVAYDHFGRVKTVDYPIVAGIDRVSIAYSYNKSNYLKEVRDISDGAPGAPIWMVAGLNVDDALEQGYFGYDLFLNPNALTLSQTHYDGTGHLKSIEASRATVEALPPLPVFDVSFIYNHGGQLTARTDVIGNRTEKFQYDDIGRLNLWILAPHQVGSLRETAYVYDDIGNLTQVWIDGLLNVANHYDGAKPHAVEWADLTNGAIDDFKYDSRGRQKQGGGRSNVNYSGFDLPTSVTTYRGDKTFHTTFSYDAHRARVRKQSSDGEVTTSVAGLYERRGSGPGAYQHVFRVDGGTGTVAELMYNESDVAAGVTKRYIIADRLGSVSLVTDTAGTALERLFFDPFGKRIDAGGAPVANATITQHGFTDHVHDDELGLINMQGRIFDPAIRRFLTPDPLVSNPLLGQAYNRYSYVLNDPVNLVDPTGFEGTPPGGSPIPSPSAHMYGPCGEAGACGWGGRDGGRKPVLHRSDSQGWDDYGCPQSAGGWATGPCLAGQIGAGCGGAVAQARPCAFPGDQGCMIDDWETFFLRNGEAVAKWTGGLSVLLLSVPALAATAGAMVGVNVAGASKLAAGAFAANGLWRGGLSMIDGIAEDDPLKFTWGMYSAAAVAGASSGGGQGLGAGPRVPVSQRVGTRYGGHIPPGPYAGRSIPARGPGYASRAERELLRGEPCHTCGTREYGTKSGLPYGDHQPPNAFTPLGGPQRIFPHCQWCSTGQGNEVKSILNAP